MKGQTGRDSAMRERKSAKSLTLKSKLSPGESPEESVAKMMVECVAMNAVTAVAFSKTLGELDLTEVMLALTLEARRVRSGDLGRLEEMLAAQAVVLNAMFTKLAYQTSQMTIVDQIDRFTRLGLKAQGQCRATVETLALMKNPPSGAVFARQANIANGPQQVNNGPQARIPASSRARGKSRQPRQSNYWRPMVNGWTQERRTASRASPSGAGDRGSNRPARERPKEEHAPRVMPTKAEPARSGARSVGRSMGYLNRSVSANDPWPRESGPQTSSCR